MSMSTNIPSSPPRLCVRIAAAAPIRPFSLPLSPLSRARTTAFYSWPCEYIVLHSPLWCCVTCESFRAYDLRCDTLIFSVHFYQVESANARPYKKSINWGQYHRRVCSSFYINDIMRVCVESVQYVGAGLGAHLSPTTRHVGICACGQVGTWASGHLIIWESRHMGI